MTESYTWVLSCIKSCRNKFQLESCRVLLSLFKIKYDTETTLADYLQTAILEADTFMSVDA